MSFSTLPMRIRCRQCRARSALHSDRKIPAFIGAKRRIYMIATLPDDDVLVSHFQADAGQVADPVGLKGGGDIGDRMILAPQEINPNITVDEIKALVTAKAKIINVAGIVPSKKKGSVLGRRGQPDAGR